MNTDEEIIPLRIQQTMGQTFNCGHCKNIIMQQNSLNNWKHLKQIGKIQSNLKSGAIVVSGNNYFRNNFIRKMVSGKHYFTPNCMRKQL